MALKRMQKHINIGDRLSKLRHSHPLELLSLFRTALSTLKFRYVLRCCQKGCIVGFNTQIINFSNVKIGSGSFIQDNVYMRAGVDGRIELGNSVAINSHAKLFGHGGIVVGDYAQIGPGATLTTTTHDINNEMEAAFHTITIGAWAWIGANATILAGIEIGEHSVIGAGSVVTKNIPAYSVAVGNPARVIKEVTRPKITD